MPRLIRDTNVLRRFVEYRDPVYPVTNSHKSVTYSVTDSAEKSKTVTVMGAGHSYNLRLQKLVVESNPPGFASAEVVVEGVVFMAAYYGRSFYYPHNGSFTVLLTGYDVCQFNLSTPLIANSSLYFQCVFLYEAV